MAACSCNQFIRKILKYERDIGKMPSGITNIQKKEKVLEKLEKDESEFKGGFAVFIHKKKNK